MFDGFDGIITGRGIAQRRLLLQQIEDNEYESDDVEYDDSEFEYTIRIQDAYLKRTSRNRLLRKIIASYHIHNRRFIRFQNRIRDKIEELDI